MILLISAPATLADPREPPEEKTSSSQSASRGGSICTCRSARVGAATATSTPMYSRRWGVLRWMTTL
ncbi:MAG: hypothetical protein DI600_09855, partial [Cutibacterium granulosum]